MVPRTAVGIVGGGFGGLYALFYLKKDLVRSIDVTLFDKNNSLGFMFGVCEIHGSHFKGWIAWFLWKAFKLAMLPRYKNRFQIVADWFITLLFKRDTSKLM